jgi:hypothetical protein
MAVMDDVNLHFKLKHHHTIIRFMESHQKLKSNPFFFPASRRLLSFLFVLLAYNYVVL